MSLGTRRTYRGTLFTFLALGEATVRTVWKCINIICRHNITAQPRGLRTLPDIPTVNLT